MENLNLLSRKKFTMDKFLSQMKVSAESEIAKILTSSASAVITSKECSNGIVSVGGKVKVAVIYKSTDGKIESVEGSFDFIEKQTSNFALDDLFVCDEVKVVSVNASNLDVIVTVEHNATVFGSHSYEIGANFADDASLVLDKKSFNSLRLTKSAEDTFVVAEEADSSLANVVVLSSSARAICTDINSSVDKIVVEGKVVTEVIYTADGNIGETSREIEFKQEIQANGVLPNMTARADLAIMNINVTAEEKDNKTNLVYAIDVYAKVFAYEEAVSEIVTDMFSLTNEIQTKTGFIESQDFAERKLCNENLTISTNIFEIENLDDISGVFEPYYEVVSVEQFDEHVKVNGIIHALALYRSNDDIEKFEITEPASFEVSKEMAEMVGNIVSAIQVSAFRIRSGGRELETELKVSLEVEFETATSEKFIQSYEVLSEKPESTGGVKVYIAGSGDTLFEVAKAVNVKPEVIAEQNEVDGVFESGEKIYIYSPINLI